MALLYVSPDKISHAKLNVDGNHSGIVSSQIFSKFTMSSGTLVPLP